MSIDAKKYPTLASSDADRSCPCCGGEMMRVEAFNRGWWHCTQCDADERYTDAEMEARLVSTAERSYESLLEWHQQ